MTDFEKHAGLLVAGEAWLLLKSAGLDSFQAFMDYPEGRRIVHKRGRSVFRLEIAGRAFYLKRNRLHRVELCKSLCRGRWPRLGARREWENLLAMEQIGIPTVTPVAMGERSYLGLETSSFTLTEELYGAEPLDVLLKRDYAQPRTKCRTRELRRLIAKMARLARRLHGAGMNHQDFYLNHFFLDGGGRLYLLDLQRVQRRRKVPRHSVIKDLAQLHYSADHYAVGSRTDRMRFFLTYLDVTALGAEEKRLARLIVKKVRRIARHDVKLLARRRQRGELPQG